MIPNLEKKNHNLEVPRGTDVDAKLCELTFLYILNIKNKFGNDKTQK